MFTSFPFAFWRGASGGGSPGFGYNYGYEFDGVDEMVTSSSSLSLTTDDAFSFSYWFKRPIATTFSEDIVGEVSSSSNSCILIKGNSAYPGIIIIADDGSRVDAQGTVRYKGFNEWTHVLWTKNTGQDRSDLKLYVNGSLETTQAIFLNNLNSGQNITCDNFYIGGHSVGVNSPSYFTGRLDDIQFYDFELNATQVSDIYNSGYVTAPTAAPIHHWKLGEEDTFSTNWTVKDSVGSLDGTSVNMEEVDRKLGVAYSMAFDGVDEYLTFSNRLPVQRNVAFSFSFWLNPSSLNSFVFSDSNGSKGWWVYLSSGGAIFLTMRETSSSNEYFCSGSLGVTPSGNWHYVSITYDGTDATGMKCYVDGVDVTVTGSNTLSTDILEANNFQISALNSGSNYNGYLMYASFFDTELSASDVTSLYNSGVPIDPRDVGLSPSFFAPLGGPNDSFSTNWTIVDEINGNNGTSVNMEEADKTSETP